MTNRIGRRTFLATCARGAAAAVLGQVPFLTASTIASATTGPGSATVAGTRRSWYAMGTVMEIAVADLPRPEALAAIRRAKARVEQLESILTVFREEAPLPCFHRTPAQRWFEIPIELAGALQTAAEGWTATKGDFDPSVGPLTRTWRGQPSWTSRPGLGALEVDLPNRRIRRLDTRMELDLGGIGKGIAIDAALSELSLSGSSAALINFGGSLGVSGPPPDRPEGWPVGIQHPRSPEELCAVLDLKKGHLATSGDYERYVERDGVRQHHILDPRTGRSTSGIAAVTVLSDTSTAADVQSTGAMVAIAARRPSWSPHFVAFRVGDDQTLQQWGPLLRELGTNAG